MVMNISGERKKESKCLIVCSKNFPGMNFFLLILLLQGVQRKVLDVMNTLGLSNTVMRVIERRTSQVVEKSNVLFCLASMSAAESSFSMHNGFLAAHRFNDVANICAPTHT